MSLSSRYSVCRLCGAHMAIALRLQARLDMRVERYRATRFSKPASFPLRHVQCVLVQGDAVNEDLDFASEFDRDDVGQCFGVRSLKVLS